MAYKISPDLCVACGTCIDECPVEAISAGDVYVIDPDKCIDCGTCAGVCPSEAIRSNDDDVKSDNSRSGDLPERLFLRSAPKNTAMIRTICLAAALLAAACTRPTDDLEHRLDEALEGRRARIGVAVRTPDGRTIRRGDVPLPLLSVFKVPVALAALDRAARERMPLSAPFDVGPERLDGNTYSPMRDSLPPEGGTVTLAGLIRYSISLSDNILSCKENTFLAAVHFADKRTAHRVADHGEWSRFTDKAVNGRLQPIRHFRQPAGMLGQCRRTAETGQIQIYTAN